MGGVRVKQEEASNAMEIDTPLAAGGTNEDVTSASSATTMSAMTKQQESLPPSTVETLNLSEEEKNKLKEASWSAAIIRRNAHLFRRSGLTKFQTLSHQHTALQPSETASDVPAIHRLVEPHIASFDALFQFDEAGGLLDHAMQDIGVKELQDAQGNIVRYWIENVHLAKPVVSDRKQPLKTSLMPTEARERGITYRGRFSALLYYTINGGPILKEEKSLGVLPIMLKSTKCHLHGMSPADLIEANEEGEELGGYFITNGIERLIRLLIVQKRNHVFTFPYLIIS